MNAPLPLDSDQPQSDSPAPASATPITAVEMGRRRWAGVSAADRSEAMRRLTRQRNKRLSPEKRKKIAIKASLAAKKVRAARRAERAAESAESAAKPRKKRGRPKKSG